MKTYDSQLGLVLQPQIQRKIMNTAIILKPRTEADISDQPKTDVT